MTTYYHNGNPNCYTHFPGPISEPVIHSSPAPSNTPVVNVPEPPKVNTATVYAESFNPFRALYSSVPLKVEENN
jgi:hypothetical protein